MSTRAKKRLRDKFGALFGDTQQHKGLTVIAPKGQKENIAQRNFVKEWTATLQLLRGLAKAFEALSLRPKWVARDAHPAVRFNQFLHAYYYVLIRGGGSSDEDDEGSSVEKVERSHERKIRATQNSPFAKRPSGGRRALKLRMARTSSFATLLRQCNGCSALRRFRKSTAKRSTTPSST